jgi:hypothetical protein
MFYKKITNIILIGLGFFFHVQQATAFSGDTYRNPFYFGIKGGGGTTTWGSLVASKNQYAMSTATPIDVHEGGGVWGFYAGYEFIPTFAVEGAYTRYPDAKLTFDSFSLFAFDHEGLTKFTTHTETVSLSGKFMVLIPNTSVRAFSSVGLAGLHRKDMIEDRWRASAAFDVGFNYNINDHLMAEIGFNYTSGYGESEINPAEDFMPFLYSGYLRLAYRL